MLFFRLSCWPIRNPLQTIAHYSYLQVAVFVLIFHIGMTSNLLLFYIKSSQTLTFSWRVRKYDCSSRWIIRLDIEEDDFLITLIISHIRLKLCMFDHSKWGFVASPKCGIVIRDESQTHNHCPICNVLRVSVLWIVLFT